MPVGQRGQLVLVAAAAIAIALVPLSLAYLQLGYHADVDAAVAEAAPGHDAERVLGHAVHNASGAVDGRYTWSQREAALARFDAAIRPSIDRLRRSRLTSGVGYVIVRNQSAARLWARENCPGGSMRRFGSCQVRDGVVVQNRAGETAVLAVGFDVHVVEQRGSMDLTLVIPAIR